MTRFGVLGDVHSEDVILAAALELFAREQVDRVLAVGDLVDGPGDPLRTFELLAGADCVAGNHDRWYLEGVMRELPDALPAGTLGAEHQRWLAALPATRTYPTPDGALLLCHGLDTDDMASLRPHDFGYGLDNNDALQRLLREGRYRFVVSGHSHRRMVRKLGATTFINAGTLLREHSPGVLVLDVARRTADFFDWTGTSFAGASSHALD